MDIYGKIYQITNKVNEKIYIGKTLKSLEDRFKRHYYSSNGPRPKTYLHKAIKKYGIENFEISLLEVVDATTINDKEKAYIKHMNPEYNMTIGGDGGNTSSSPNYIEGMRNRDFNGSNNPMFGRKRNISKQQLDKAHKAASIANKCAVMCEGIYYNSIHEAGLTYGSEKRIRRRLDDPKWPQFYRLREKTKRKLVLQELRVFSFRSDILNISPLS